MRYHHYMLTFMSIIGNQIHHSNCLLITKNEFITCQNITDGMVAASQSSGGIMTSSSYLGYMSESEFGNDGSINCVVSDI